MCWLKLVSARIDEWALYVFLCSFVLMSLLFYVSCSRWHCTVIEIRSLVLARDDGIVGMCAKRVLQVKREAELQLGKTQN